MTGGRVIEANTDFYRYPICHLPSAVCRYMKLRKQIAKRMQLAIKQDIMKKKEGGDIYGKNSKCICTC